ncbi:hypothetical protein [Pandoraea sp.]|uniref:hypothetical protein n=1 Tax=Pandoraea sp. TaxID=1883445 RepID=UPI0035B19B55
MELNAYPLGGHSVGSPANVSAVRAKRAELLPEAGPLGTFGAVTGHDGSGAPLPPIGPFDFSAARRVHDDIAMGASGAVVRLTFEAHAHATQYLVRASPNVGHATRTWLASRLFGALGLATPTAMLVRGCSLAFDGTQAPERIYLATTYLPAYRALGEWLEGDAARRAIEGAQGVQGGVIDACERARDGALAAGRQMASVLEQAGAGPLGALAGAAAQAHADAARARHEMRGVLCRSLPDVYRCALERHYVAALWLGNRDVCNAFMDNVGVWRDKNDLPYMMTVDFRRCLDFDSQCPLTEVTQFCCDDPFASFVRGLTGLADTAPGKTVLDELKDPTGVRALAAEMAFRLGRITGHAILPWIESAHEAVRSASPVAEGAAPAWDRDGFVSQILARRDSLVALLGGPWAAQAWAQLYPMRARAIEAQQEPFLRAAAAGGDSA